MTTAHHRRCSPKPKSRADLVREVDGFEHVPDRLRGRPVAVVSAGRVAERVDPELEIHCGASQRNADRDLARVCACGQRGEGVGRLRELVRRLDGYAQRAVGEQAREAFEVFGVARP